MRQEVRKAKWTQVAESRLSLHMWEECPLKNDTCYRNGHISAMLLLCFFPLVFGFSLFIRPFDGVSTQRDFLLLLLFQTKGFFFGVSHWSRTKKISIINDSFKTFKAKALTKTNAHKSFLFPIFSMGVYSIFLKTNLRIDQPMAFIEHFLHGIDSEAMKRLDEFWRDAVEVCVAIGKSIELIRTY